MHSRFLAAFLPLSQLALQRILHFPGVPTPSSPFFKSFLIEFLQTLRIYW
jgi:hypothetical protein